MRPVRHIAICAVLLGLGLPAAAHADFTVNQAGDEADMNLADAVCDVSGDGGIQCTLRAAIQEANDTAGSDLIAFALSNTEVTTITPATAYPEITGPVNISGYSQAGSQPNTQPFGKPLDTELRVEIDASDIPVDFNAETFEFENGSAPSTLQGLVLTGNPNTAIRSDLGSNVTIRGNFIGTTPDGMEADPNISGFFGFAGTVTIGGPDPGDTNLISSNTESAISSNTGVSVERNYIGVGADAKKPLRNGNPANIFSQAIGFYGGPNRLVQNIIAENRTKAFIAHNSGTVTYISRNRIFKNPGIGLDLQDDGVTPNDPLDADANGPNQLQNFPVVKKAKAKQGALKISAVLKSEPSGNYQVELFEAKRKRREARRFLGSFGATADAEGVARVKGEIGKRVKRGRFITATATDLSLGSEGGTSELSRPRKVK